MNTGLILLLSGELGTVLESDLCKAALQEEKKRKEKNLFFEKVEDRRLKTLFPTQPEFPVNNKREASLLT